MTGQARAAAADPVSVLKYTAKERKGALAHWTPARVKAVGKSVDLGPTGPKAKPYRGTPLKTVGRLFFVNANGADTWCTATAVKSANKSAVMTAAHCVRRGSSPYNTSTDMVFVPGYSKGRMPYGTFAVRSAATPRAWVADSTDDLAALTVDTDKKGRKAHRCRRRPGHRLQPHRRRHRIRPRLPRHQPAARRGAPALRRYGEEGARHAGHPL
ncbi:trypsin-like serine peptidase [Streptomyces sp. NPDC050509]|uniref:trypsin-like serine peptidase n=1 Tax=Streptomyces sp. NPDC050509 TaxID=3365620 RepID=UPI0037AEFC00